MNANWMDYLRTRGAQPANAGIDFGDPAGELAAARDQLVVADLSDWGLIGLAGEEAQTFLHGQITNDLRELDDGSAVFAGYCSAKGRLLANFLVLRAGDDLLVMLPQDVREAVQKRLSMFVLRAKVKVRDASAEWVRLGLSGPGADALVQSLVGSLPAATPMRMARSDALIALRLGPDRFDLLVQPEAAEDLWEKLASQARPVGSAAWNWLLTCAGVPVVHASTQDQFVPQMTNMEVLHGVSFSKGCYPGQEIVARTQYLGKLKRRMFLAHVDAEATAGADVFSPLLAGQTAGMVINAAPSPEGGYDLLAVTRIDCHDDNRVHLGSADGPQLKFRPLPYSL